MVFDNNIERSNPMLSGKAVLITGASQGIGKGLAVAAAGAGASVMVTARKLEAARAVVSEIEARGGRAAAYRCDVADRGEVEGAVASTLEKFGSLDAVVHNAMAVVGLDGQIEEVAPESWNTQVVTALRGAFYFARASFAGLCATHGSFIVMTSSGGIEGSRDRPVYSCVKGAQRAFVKSLAQEWGPFGVRVNAISPAAMTPKMRVNLETHPELRKYIEDGIPLARVGDSEADVGAAMNFLIGPGGAYITAHTLTVDGGRCPL